LRPDERGGATNLDRAKKPDEVGFGCRAVLEVDEQPVIAGPRRNLCCKRRAKVEEEAEERLAGEDAPPEGLIAGVVHIDIMPVAAVTEMPSRRECSANAIGGERFGISRFHTR
jgi:hypothetical protein